MCTIGKVYFGTFCLILHSFLWLEVGKYIFLKADLFRSGLCVSILCLGVCKPHGEGSGHTFPKNSAPHGKDSTGHREQGGKILPQTLIQLEHFKMLIQEEK